MTLNRFCRKWLIVGSRESASEAVLLPALASRGSTFGAFVWLRSDICLTVCCVVVKHRSETVSNGLTQLTRS